MKKSDLKDGMKVKLREGSYMSALVSRGLLYSIPESECDYYSEYLELKSYTDDLSHSAEEDFIEKDFDIMKIYDIQDKLIWERKEVDWSKVPFGTKVKCWDDTDKEPYNGVFLEYNSDNMYPFQVYVPKKDCAWENCELAEEVQEAEETEGLTINQCFKEKKEICDKYISCKGCKYEEALKREESCLLYFVFDNYNITRK